MVLGQWGKAYLKRRAQKRDLSWRKPPQINLGTGRGDPGVFYLAPDENKASGGVRVIYRHVDLLNEMGIKASVIHSSPGFRCDWFQNTTSVVSAENVRLREDDLLVLPEYTAPWFGSLSKTLRTVVFNQGPHYTYSGVPMGSLPYEQLGILEGILTVSDDGGSLLSNAFPDVPVSIVRNVIDKDIFHPEKTNRSRVISYIPSRRHEELQQFLHILGSREEFTSQKWKLQELQGLGEREMANALRSSAVFVSLSHRDGFGLPPAEAMACGAYVVGHPGGGGKEFFDSTYCTIAQDNTELVQGVLDAIKMPADVRNARGQKASAAILGKYTRDGLKSDLDRFYRGLL